MDVWNLCIIEYFNRRVVDIYYKYLMKLINRLIGNHFAKAGVNRRLGFMY